jgi:hypothetical protein
MVVKGFGPVSSEASKNPEMRISSLEKSDTLPFRAAGGRPAGVSGEPEL